MAIFQAKYAKVSQLHDVCLIIVNDWILKLV